MDGRKGGFDLWDTVGQEQCQSLAPSFCREGAAALVVFAITRQESLYNVTGWMQALRTTLPQARVILFGNKCYLESEPVNLRLEAEMVASGLEIEYFEDWKMHLSLWGETA
jgi:GTPase SAR1 family protein